MILFQNKHVTVFQSALFQTDSCVIHTDDMVLVVDPNWLPAEVETIRVFTERLLGEKKRPLYLLFTHSDYDHIIGYRAFPGATVIASEAFVQNTKKQSVVEQILTWDDENYITRNYPIEYPQVDFAVKNDGQSLQIGQTTLTFYLAPGHNPDGIFTLVEPVGIWLAGDYLAEVEFPYIYYSSVEYEKVLGKVAPILDNHAVKILAPGHGQLAFTIDEIFERRDESLSYIQALRKAIRENTPFDTANLWQRYRYPRVMKRFHDGNVELLKKELANYEL